MEPQERDLITTLLSRLQSTAGQPKDPEADAMIRQAMTQMPDAPYYLVQTVLIQDLSLHNAQNRIADLEKQVASLNPPLQQQQPGSFLGGLFGRSQSGSAPAPSVPPSGGPWTRVQQPAPPPQYAPGAGYAQPGYAQPGPAAGMFGGGAGGGNSFLRSAATTAAGVAGGALLFEGISSLFGHGFAGGLGGMGMGGMQGGLGETVINNNYYGDSQGAAPGDYGGGGDYSGGGDSGGGGDGGDYGGGGDSGGGDFGGGDDSSSSC
ncbi:MAG TPA: DUF2076 domain-containing protein [Stellaceae bacterium]|nr:DUF2076 domain-containing protein [Stellaceae bacterium]